MRFKTVTLGLNKNKLPNTNTLNSVVVYTGRLLHTYCIVLSFKGTKSRFLGGVCLCSVSVHPAASWPQAVKMVMPCRIAKPLLRTVFVDRTDAQVMPLLCLQITICLDSTLFSFNNVLCSISFPAGEEIQTKDRDALLKFPSIFV